MKAPQIADDNFIRAQQRRAGAEIEAGIEAQIEALHQQAPFKRAFEFAAFAALYLSGAALAILTEGWFRLPGILLMGVAMNSLGIFLHEGLHGLLAVDPRRNHLLSFLVGLPLLLSATAYQTTHNDHHYDLGRKLDYGTYRQHLDKPGLVWTAYFAQLILGSLIYILFIPVLAWKSGTRRDRLVIVVEYLLIALAFALFVRSVSLDVLLIFWLYPLLVVNVLSNLRGVASHAMGDVEDIYLSSRTVRCSRWMEWVFLHENYHLEHHLYPRVPSYHLRPLHQLIRDRLPRALEANSYLDFLRMFCRAARHLDLRPQGVRMATNAAGEHSP